MADEYTVANMARDLQKMGEINTRLHAEIRRLREATEAAIVEGAGRAVVTVLDTLQEQLDKVAADPKMAFMSGPDVLRGTAKTIRDLKDTMVGAGASAAVDGADAQS